jgi:hypothetical protein
MIQVPYLISWRNTARYNSEVTKLRNKKLLPPERKQRMGVTQEQILTGRTVSAVLKQIFAVEVKLGKRQLLRSFLNWISFPS